MCALETFQKSKLNMVLLLLPENSLQINFSHQCKKIIYIN